jgi:WD40 repeat protein
VRFCLQQNVNDPTLLWEVAADGTGLHRLLPDRSKPPDSELGDRWTNDGNYFLYESRGQIWALPRKRGFLRGEPKPVQLTSSPFPVSGAFPSKNGKKLFVVGETDRGELVRFDSKSRQYVPFLGGISAEFAAFSNDGQWVAYVSYPDGTLWRCKVDGSQRLQLSFPPDYAFLPRWSPDSAHIAFFVIPPGRPSRMYQISVDGGSAQPLLPEDSSVQQDPNWSPDGNKIVFSGGAADSSSTVRILDLATHHVETVPGSQGLFSARWSPDGRYLAALSVDSTRILLFDFQSGKWTQIAKGTPGWPAWSKDGRSIEYIDSRGISDAAVVKVRLSDHKIQQILEFNNIVTAGKYGISLALAPDESPLILRNTGTQDVYSLDWQEQ